MVYTSCKISYNVLSQVRIGLNCACGGGGGGGEKSLLFLGGGGVMRKKDSQDFIFPEVGISGLYTTTTANTLVAASNRFLIAVVHLRVVVRENRAKC